MLEPKCPANYFGLGADYVLPEDIEIVREFELKFSDWVTKNPDDPTGELAIAAYQKYLAQNPKAKAELAKPKYDAIVINPNDYDDAKQLRLQLPADLLEVLKKFAKAKKRRPRDIIIHWIKTHCVWDQV